MTKLVVATSICVYLAAGCMTFGWQYNNDHSAYWEDVLRRGPNAVLAGLFWPLYWGGTLGLRLRQPAD